MTRSGPDYNRPLFDRPEGQASYERLLPAHGPGLQEAVLPEAGTIRTPEGGGIRTGSDFDRLDHTLKKGRHVTGHRKGSRKVLGEYFYYDLMSHWREFGPQALQRVYEQDPVAYVKAAISILPKDVNINVTHYDGLTIDDLRKELLQLTNTIDGSLVIEADGDDAGGGTPPPADPETGGGAGPQEAVGSVKARPLQPIFETD